MAKAQCHCAVCGNDFEIKVKRRNKEEATSFEEWAAKNITVCRECERKMKKKEDHERALKNSDGLPALEGTEKQIAWAFDIRGKFTDFSFLDDCSKGFFIEHYLQGKTRRSGGLTIESHPMLETCSIISKQERGAMKIATK